MSSIVSEFSAALKMLSLVYVTFLICILSFTSKVWNAFLSLFRWHVLASAKIMMTTRRTLLTGRTKHSPYLRPPTGAHEYPQEWVFLLPFLLFCCGSIPAVFLVYYKEQQLLFFGLCTQFCCIAILKGIENV